MAKFTWRNYEVPLDMRVRQVYGIIFGANGKILMMVDNDSMGNQVFTFSGGKPEEYDVSMEDTLRRELNEEINTTIGKDVFYLGFQEVDEEDGTPVFAHVRMTAMVENIGDKRPDIDNGKVYDRVFVSPNKAIKLLNWGKEGRLQVEKAVEVARKNFNLIISEDDEEIWV